MRSSCVSPTGIREIETPHPVFERLELPSKSFLKKQRIYVPAGTLLAPESFLFPRAFADARLVGKLAEGSIGRQTDYLLLFLFCRFPIARLQL